MPTRAFCVHAHFYQPSREDPLTGLIPDESGSEPFANWNERVNERCYRPNAEIGNFEKISFNLGPTLTRWMESYSRDTLDKVIASDHKNLAEYGVGNAMAQPYHHTILPLASRQDKEVQVHWGVADFVHTFGHLPHGMWLPETAVDVETLTVMAEAGIQFTILAPWQAGAEDIDVTKPYRVNLPFGKSIIIFFYQEELSGSISFDPSTTLNADDFVRSRISKCYRSDEKDQLLMAATDGELYGHHQPFREKFLSYLLNGALTQAGIQAMFPALWLKDHAVNDFTTIKEDTSWSCSHGITRWMDVCDCTPGGTWKKGLRELLNQVAIEVDSAYEKIAGRWLKDSRKALDEYIREILGEQTYQEWEDVNVVKGFSQADSSALQKLMRSQFERQRMFTSCGWFFEEFDRIEPRNNLKYAAHAIALAESASGFEIAKGIQPVLARLINQKNSAENYDLFNYAMTRFGKESDYSG